MHHESEILGEGGKPMRKHRITAVMAAMFCMILMAGCGNSKAVQEQQMTLRSQGMEQAKGGDCLIMRLMPAVDKSEQISRLR